MRFGRNWVLRNEEEAGGSGGGGGSSGGGMDIAAAVSEIGAGLGFSSEENDNVDAGADLDAGDTGTGSESRAPVASPAPTSAPVATPASTAAPAAASSSHPPAVDVTKPPQTWRAPAQALWGNLPPEAQQEIHKREQDMFNGLEQYKGEAQFSRAMKQVLAPLAPVFQNTQVSPAQFVGEMAKLHMTLSDARTPAAQRLEYASAVLRTYGLELPAPDPQDGTQGTYVDPQVKGLQDQIALLQSRLNDREQREAITVRQNLEGDVQKFAEDPANQYFYEVADDIALLIRGSGGKMTLKEAYDRAIHANPVTRAKEQQRLTAEALQKQQETASQHAAKARKATSANVETRSHQASKTATLGSMDDTLQETLATIKAREK